MATNGEFTTFYKLVMVVGNTEAYKISETSATKPTGDVIALGLIPQ